MDFDEEGALILQITLHSSHYSVHILRFTIKFPTFVSLRPFNVNQTFGEPTKDYKTKHYKILITVLHIQLAISPATSEVSYNFTHKNQPVI
jgi:hypothetical protein